MRPTSGHEAHSSDRNRARSSKFLAAGEAARVSDSFEGVAKLQWESRRGAGRVIGEGR